MSSKRTLLMALIAFSGCVSKGPDLSPSEPQAPGEWLRRSEEHLTKAGSAQWTLELSVDKPLSGVLDAGEHRFQFQIRGTNRAHWTEEHPAAQDRVNTEVWYDGETAYFRSSKAPNGLAAARVGEDEGECVRLSMVRGGILGWLLVHATMNGRLEIETPRLLRLESYGGRPAAVVEYKIKLRSVCSSSETLPGCRIWIDRESLLPLKREYALLLKVGGKEIPFVGTEVFSNWILDAEIDDALFRTPGMKPPSLRATLPQDPEAYEAAMTEHLHGIKLQPFPGPGGSRGFSKMPSTGLQNLSATVEPLQAMTNPNSLQDEEGVPAPAHDRPMRNAVARPIPGGEYLEAWDGTHGDLEVEPTEGVLKESSLNLRHRYKGYGGYVGNSLHIGPVKASRISPILSFRDPGFQSSGPLDMRIDDQGLCHLVFADRDPSQGGRLKLLYLVGDLAKHQWIEGWTLHERAEQTECSGIAMVLEGTTLWITWCQSTRGAGSETDGIYCVSRSTNGFSEKTHLWAGKADHIALARDPKGSLLLVWRPEKGDIQDGFLASVRNSGGRWSNSAQMSLESMSLLDGIGIFGIGDGRFRIRIYDYKSGYRSDGLFGKVSQWNLRVSAP